MSETKRRAELVESVVARYLKARRNVALYREGYDDIALGDEKEDVSTRLKKEEAFIAYVNDVFTMLSPESRVLLANDYYWKKGVYWWIETYSRSTYYRRKNKALKEFAYYYSLC